MKKTFTIIFFLSLFAFKLLGKTADVNLCKQVAKNYYLQNAFAKNVQLQLAYTDKAATGDTDIYYVFNINENDGWVIVAADENSLPILGYSLAGHFTMNNPSPEFLFWMHKYSSQILAIKRSRIKATIDISDEWKIYSENQTQSNNRILTVGSHLINTTWGQNQFYNANCPTGVPTGCVATAMAQIMKYWNYPATGYSSHSYTDPHTPECNSTVVYPSYGTQSANFGSTSYDWTCMPHALSSANNAVSTLMRHCGVSVEMDYAPVSWGGSGAWVVTDNNMSDCNSSTHHAFSAEHAYKTYFRYNASTIHGVLKSNYTTSGWINLLKTEIDAGRPVQYGGWDISNNAGHSWVCDGYNSSNQFYMNWGWNGSSNGFFSVSNLNPNNVYNDSDEAIIGIKPSGTYPLCSNDECSNAITLQPCEKNVYNNLRSTNSTTSPTFSCFGGNYRDVWFKIISPTTSVSVEVNNTSLSCGLSDLAVQIYSGTCGNLTRIACNISNGSTPAFITLNNLTNSNTLYVRVTYLYEDDGEFYVYYRKIATGTSIFNSVSYTSGDGSGVHQYTTLTGDVNGDKKSDLIFPFMYGNNGLTIRTKMSNGDGTFTPYQDIQGDGSNLFNRPVLTGDVNGDKKTDFIFTYKYQHAQNISLVINTKISNGNGTFTAHADTLTDDQNLFSYATHTGDLNGDKKTDLIFPCYTSSIGLIIRTKFSNGNGTFTAHADTLGDGVTIFNRPVLTGDINGDGLTDVIFPYQHPSQGLVIRTKLSNGNGTFTAVSDTMGDGTIATVYPTLSGDVNGDGKTDLIFPCYSSSAGLFIRTKMSDGNGKFTAYVDTLGDGSGVFDYPVLAADINGDGRTDLIFNGQDWSACGLNIRIKYSNGDGTWCADKQMFGDGSGVHAYPTLVADVTGDKKADIIFNFDDNTLGLIIRTKISQGNTSCFADSSQLLPPLGENQFQIFPTLTNGYVQMITADTVSMQVEVFDILGKKMFTPEIVNGHKQFDLTSFSKGVYFFSVTNLNTDQRIVKKVVKQ